MTKKNNKENFETVIVDAVITATSNKEDVSFKQKNGATKTMYFSCPEIKDCEKLEKLGLTLYKTEDKDVDDPYFFVVKTKLVTPVFSIDGERISEFDTSTKSLNFYTENVVKLAVVKVKNPEKGKNDYYRISGIMVGDIDDIVEIEPANPFAELFE